MAPKIDEIRESIAAIITKLPSIAGLLNIERNQIGITATTGEGLTRTSEEEKVLL